MKKVLSIILSMTILMSVFVATFPITAESSSKYQKYKTVVKNIITDGDEFTYGNAFMRDLNRDGIKELVTFNNLPLDLGLSYSSCEMFFSVYTLKNGRLKTIVKNKLYCNFGGACYNGVGVATKNGKKYLVVFKDYGSGDVSPNYYRGLIASFYKVTDKKIKRVKTAKFSMKADNTVNPLKIKNRSCKIGGKKVSYTKLKNWFKSYKYSFIKYTYQKYHRYHSFNTKSKTLTDFYSSM